jgi:hypothetical protein
MDSQQESLRDADGLLVPGENTDKSAIIEKPGHRVFIHRTTRGSGKNKVVNKCTAYCTCGWDMRWVFGNALLNKKIQEHFNEVL